MASQFRYANTNLEAAAGHGMLLWIIFVLVPAQRIFLRKDPDEEIFEISLYAGDIPTNYGSTLYFRLQIFYYNYRNQ